MLNISNVYTSPSFLFPITILHWTLWIWELESALSFRLLGMMLLMMILLEMDNYTWSLQCYFVGIAILISSPDIW